MAKLVLTIEAKSADAIKGVQALKAQVDALAQSLSHITVNKDLTAQIDALTKHYKAVINAQARLNKQASGIETTRKGYANLITSLKTLKTQYADGVFGKLPQDAERAFKKMEEISAAFEKNGKLTAKQQKIYAQLSQQLKKYSADLATVKAKNDKITAANPFTVTQAQQIPRLIKQYSTLLNTIKSTEKYYPKGTFDTIKADLVAGQADLQALNQEFLNTGTLSESSQTKLNELANSYNQLNASVAQTTSTMKSSKGGLRDIVMGFAKFQLAAMLVMKPLQWVRSALSSLNETLVKTEDIVIALQRVLPTGSATDDEISSKIYDIAKRYGQTRENVSEIATNFARTGMSWTDTIKATEAAVLALNVAELDTEEATNGLIAILSQFNLKASDLEIIIDKLNKTADNFPVTTQKILAALQRTGSAASNANLTLDETISLVTALSKATGRSGENIGTALNSLIQYSSKSSALDTFAALSKESAAVVNQFRQGGATILDVWQQVSKEIKNLKSDQADLLDQYFSTEDGTALQEALDGELQDIYTELGGVYDTANTFRKNYFIALLGNMDTVEQAMGTLGDAAGYSQKENEKYLNTYTAKLNSVQAKWQDIANDEQGLLGIKKDLLDLGSTVLDIIQGVGGLKTALVAVGFVVGTLVLTFKGEAIIATLTKIGTVLKSLTIDAIPNAIGAWKSFARGITSAGTAIQASLPILAAVVIAISAIDSAIRRNAEERAEAERKAREEQDAAIVKTNEAVDAQKKEVQSMEEVAASVEELRNVLNDSTASEEYKKEAQVKLLQIQNALIDSNNGYKDSLDLTNGSLKEQLGLIEQLTTEQLKQKAQDFLSQNQAEISIAKNRLKSQSTTNTDILLSSSGWLNADKFRNLLNKAISEAGVGDVTSVIEDNTYTIYDKYVQDVKKGFKESFWKGLLASSGFITMFDETSWVGEANAGFSFSGTIEEQLSAIEKLREYISTHRDGLGLTDEQVISFTDELKNQYEALNNDSYREAQRLNDIAQSTNDWLAGTITETEYLQKVYGITRKTADETEDWHNNISKVTDKYDDLIKAIEKLRNAEKESLELEERKQAVLEAQKALDDAKNEATVRRFNEATGQWEWQTDEKKIAEAEKDLEEARRDLEEQAYDTIIDQLEQQTATNQSILDVIEAVAPLLGDEFGSAVKGAIKSGSNVDLDQPVKSYDSGGVANGLGFMPKATALPESVNDPELTAKILSPVSNEQFHRYAQDMGLMFETARQYTQSPIIERVGGNSDNSVNNSGQIIFGGGLTVGADQRGSSIDEILALAGIVTN